MQWFVCESIKLLTLVQSSFITRQLLCIVELFKIDPRMWTGVGGGGVCVFIFFSNRVWIGGNVQWMVFICIEFFLCTVYSIIQGLGVSLPF